MAQNTLSEVSCDGSLVTYTSVWQYVEEGLNKCPDGPAAIIAHQPAKHLSALHVANNRCMDVISQPREDGQPIECLSWTHRQLFRASARFVNALLHGGLSLGSATIVTFLPNGIEYPLLLWTSALGKFCLSNLDPGALQLPRRVELESFIKSLRPDVVIVPDLEGAKAVDETIAKLSLPTPRIKIVAASVASFEVHIDQANPGWKDLTQFILDGSKQVIKDDLALKQEAKDDDPARAAFVLFTSGTSTGKPKGVIRPVSTVAHTLSYQEWLITEGVNSRTLIYFANFRIAALMFSFQTWYSGGAIVMPSATFDPESALDAIQRHRITSMIAIPYQAHALIDHIKFRSTNVTTVDFVITGSDTITVELMKKLATAFPSARTVGVGHGMTEGGGMVRWSYGRNVDQLPSFGGIVPLGVMEPGARLRIVDNITGKITPLGVPGELHICSAGWVKNYLGGIKPEDFYQDGAQHWFRTGDLGMVSTDGSIYLLGRIKDIIKRAGVPVSPAALENCIARKTGAVVSVIGIPHATLGAVPFAVLSQLNNIDEADLKQLILDEFGPDYALAGAASLAQLDLQQFPLNATDKIMKIELVEPVKRFLLSRT